jgi:hypothetical protein
MKIGTIYSLNRGEQEMARYLAKIRQEEDDASLKVGNAKNSGKSDLDINVDGCGAELAFGHIFNLFPNLTIEPISASKGEDMGDFIFNGKTIDVKQTIYPQGKLISAWWKKDNACDLYALMVGEFPTFIFKGITTKEELYQDFRLTDFGRRNRAYAMYQVELDELDEIFKC